MCGRYNVLDSEEVQELSRALGISINSTIELPLYNLSPTSLVPIVILEDDGPKCVLAVWWLLLKSGPNGLVPNSEWKTFNAVSSRAMNSKLYGPALKKSRCIMPASGYYEWKGKQAYYIQPQQGAIAFAGLYRKYNYQDQVVYACTMMTTTGHPNLAHIHEKSLPVMLPKREFDAWLGPETTAQAHYQSITRSRLEKALEVLPVSGYVNNSRNKGEKCLEPAGDTQVLSAD